MFKNSRLVVVVFMFIIIVSSTCFAEENFITDDVSLKKAFTAGEEYILQNDLSLDKGINLTLDVRNIEQDESISGIIDLNGHKLDLNGSLTFLFLGKKKNVGQYSLEIKDSVGTGEINYTPKSTDSLFNISLESFEFHLSIKY